MSPRPSPRIIRGRQNRDELLLSFDRKVSTNGTWQQSRRRWIPGMPNSFGLPAGHSCPGATPFCASCYGAAAENSAGVTELVARNLELLQQAGTEVAMTDLLDRMIWRYRQHCDHIGAPPGDLLFRIHWDGDFFSLAYARAWATVIEANDVVQFWAYTRSFTDPVDVVPVLAPLDNLALYLSIDDHNAAAGRAQLAAHPGVRAAWCTIDYDTGRTLADDRHPVECPENNGRLALMDDGRGACVTCRICPDARRDIIFTTSHQKNVGQPVVLQARPPRGRGERPPYPCAGDGCTNLLRHTPGPGRPRKFCSDRCRLSRRTTKTLELTT